MQRPDAAKVPNRQIRPSSYRVRQRRTFIDKAPEQRVHGNTAPPRLVNQPGRHRMRNLDGHVPPVLGLPISEPSGFTRHFP